MAQGDPLPRVEFTHGYDTSYPHRGHYFRNAVIGIIAFIVTCLTIHEFRPAHPGGDSTQMLRYFHEHKDEFDTLFIGSSHFYRQLIPATFDRLTAENGVPTRSFNLGVGAMVPPETLSFLELVLQCRPANLKWVFIEFEEMPAIFSERVTGTRRFAWWHNWPMTWIAVRKVVDPNYRESRSRMILTGLRSEMVWCHLRTLFKNLGNVGDALDWSPLKRTIKDKYLTRDRGYRPINHEMSRKDLRQFRNQVQARPKMVTARPIDRVTEDVYRSMTKIIELNGAKPIYVVTPVLNPAERSFRIEAEAPGPVISFNQYGKYEELYEEKLRADPTHLNATGAEIFTRLFADRFVKEIPQPGQK
jgi:hypothetical protein